MRVSFPDVKRMKCPPRAAAASDIPPKQFTEQPVRPASAEVVATSSEPPTSRSDVASGGNADELLVSDAVTERVPVGVVACVSCPVLSCPAPRRYRRPTSTLCIHTHLSFRASGESEPREERELLTHWSSRRRYAASAGAFQNKTTISQPGLGDVCFE